jgi:hypothetical protein
LPAHDVHRSVRRSKTDRADAKALLEADRNEAIHGVPVKTVEAQAIATLQRLLGLVGDANSRAVSMDILHFRARVLAVYSYGYSSATLTDAGHGLERPPFPIRINHVL